MEASAKMGPSGWKFIIIIAKQKRRCLLRRSTSILNPTETIFDATELFKHKHVVVTDPVILSLQLKYGMKKQKAELAGMCAPPEDQNCNYFLADKGLMFFNSFC